MNDIILNTKITADMFKDMKAYKIILDLFIEQEMNNGEGYSE